MKKSACLLAVLGLSAASAQAATGGWIAVGAGQTDVEFEVADIDDGSFTSASDDTGGNAFRLAAGYQYTENVSLGLSWMQNNDYASFTADSNGSGWLYPASTITGDVEVSGLTFGMDAYLPLSDRARLVGHLGMLAWSVDFNIAISGYGTGSTSEDGADLYLGVGAEYDLTPSVALGGHLTRYDMDGENFNLAELGLRFRFGAH